MAPSKVRKHDLKLSQLAAPLLGNGIEKYAVGAVGPDSNGHYNPEEEELPQIVQFSTDIYYADEGDGEIEMEIVRNGPLDCCSSVDWYTEDASGKAGESYLAARGQVHYEHREIVKKITVKICQNERYDPTSEFKVRLCNPKGCEIGLYLNHARVKIIDDDVFPSNRFEGMTDEENIDRIPPSSLVSSFVWICFGVPGVGWRSLLVLLIHQFGNLYYLLKTWLLIYMVDGVFDVRKGEDPHEDARRKETILACALLWLVPFGIQHFLDIMMVKLDVSARLRGWLQMCLFSKYLTYTDRERHLVEPAAMSLAVLEQVDECVSKGYMKFWSLLGLMGKLLIVIIFMLQENPSAIWAVLIFPALMALWIRYRSATLERIGEEIEGQEKELMFSLQTACQNYFLISEYNQRPKAQDQFDECVEALNEARQPKELAETNNAYVPGWISTIAVFVYIMAMGPKVFDGHLGVGVFIAMVKILNELGDEFKEAYEMFMEIVESVGPLKRITIYINGETDLDTLKEQCADLRAETISKLEKIVNAKKLKEEKEVKKTVGHPQSEYGNDFINIEINNMRFSYADAVGVHAHLHDDGIFKRRGRSPSVASSPRRSLSKIEPWCLKVEKLQLEQGMIVAVLGRHKSGQKTLIRLLAKLLRPQQGHVFIPSHLRVLHVSRSPHILEHGLIYNLCFGLDNVDLDRVRAVAERLHLSASLQEQLRLELEDENEANSPQEKWRLQMSYTDVCWIHLARALIVNPEVVILERPVVHFDDQTADRVMRLLQEHVRNRGVAMDPATLHHRRPRTCIFSTSDRNAKYADIVWRLHLNGTVTTVEEDSRTSAKFEHDKRKAQLAQHLLYFSMVDAFADADEEDEDEASVCQTDAMNDSFGAGLESPKSLRFGFESARQSERSEIR